MPTATYFGGSCVLDESVLHAGTMFGPAGATCGTSACSLALVHLGGHIFSVSGPSIAISDLRSVRW